MGKAEILAELIRTGEDKIRRRSPMWEKAFDLHNTTSGRTKSMHCSSCFTDVLEWLKK